MRLLTLFIYCLSLGIFAPASAYITNIITWEKDGQKVIGCGDFHDVRNFNANFFQWKFLRDNLGSLDPQNTCVMAEDMKAYSGSDHRISDYFKQRGAILPQTELIDLVSQRNPGLRAVNIECRYAVSAALLPFINANEDTLIESHAVVEELDSSASLVRSFDDGEQLTTFYQEQIAAVNDRNKHMLDMMRQSSDPLTSWIRSHIPSEKQVRFARQLRLLGTRFVDLIAAHEIVQHPNIQKFLIFAGAQHIDNIGRVLVNHRGFKKTSSIGTDIDVPYGASSLDLDTLGSDAPPPGLLQRYTPLPAEQLAVLFE